MRAWLHSRCKTVNLNSVGKGLAAAINLITPPRSLRSSAELSKRQVHGYRGVIRNSLREGVVHIKHGSGKMRGQKVRTMLVARLLKIGLNEDPIEFELSFGSDGSLKLEGWDETLAAL